MAVPRTTLSWLMAGIAAMGAHGAIAQEFTQRNATVANGGAVLEAGPYRLLVTLGEPAVSQVARDGYVLTSGLQATFLEGAGFKPPDPMFVDGFENPPSPAPEFGESP